MKRHLVLVGLSGSGKSTVGPLVAASLDTHFTDVDGVIERATGLAISDLFDVEGESSFREREHQAVLDALLLPAHVIAPGGGWAAQPGAYEAVGDQVLTVYLRITPEEAARRLGDAADRPLLGGAPPVEGLERLLRQRERAYRGANVVVDAGRDASEVADELIAVARARAGW